MSKIVVANWKSNPNKNQEAVKLAKASDYKHFIVCPPAVFLDSVGRTLKRAALGSQNVFFAEQGPYTGEISLNQLKSLGVSYVIVGHSERRRYLSESDELINRKIKACLKNKLGVILCVGEWEKKSGLAGLRSARKQVKQQLEKALLNIRLNSADRIFIAYEPVWAIGGGRADEPARSAVIIAYLRKLLFSYFAPKQGGALYGGSIDSKNIRQFLPYDVVDGVLVGSASLAASEIKKIAEIAGSF